MKLKALQLPKYGTYFLVFIIIAKLIYLAVEIYYNGHLIDVITSSNVTEEAMHQLESLGHNVTSVGLTLLVTPFFYLLYKKTLRGTVPEVFPVVLGITMALLVFAFHTGLTSLMDKIILDNKEKRYSSYYISAFKYGMLNGTLGYESFMPKERLKHLKTEDRVLIANIFLLNYIDEKLIDKLITRGQDQFTDVFILKYRYLEFIRAEIAFEKKTQDIVNGYNNYITKSKEINKKFAKLDNASILDAEYADFVGKLRQQYGEYEKNVIRYERSILLSPQKKKKIHNDLYRYFKYQKYSKAKRKYKASMQKQFGHYIEPKRWCGKYCPSDYAIEKVIEEEAFKKFMKESGGIPPDLSQKGFFRHHKVKSRIVKVLRAQGLLVSKNFNYSKREFAKAYKAKINKEFYNIKKQFLIQVKKQTGKNIRFGLNYNQFVYNFKADLIKEYGKKYGNILYKMIKKQDTSEFYNKFYKPMFKERYLQEYILTKQDFEGEKYKEFGDGAIKHLYIPPFAIGMSLFAGILNFISLIVIILFLIVKIDKLSVLNQFLIKFSVKIILLVLLILYPFYTIDKVDLLSEYKALQKVQESANGELYLKILEWVMVYEKLNYEKLYVIFKSNK